MHQNGVPVRQIARVLKFSRNTVREIVRDNGEPSPPFLPQQPVAALLPDIYRQCQGNAVRMREILQNEHGQGVPYSTLTRLIRQESLRESRQRIGQYLFAPGEEMQHDTSPHRVVLAGKTVTAHCASLVLAYSRRLFVRYFPVFTRFEVKLFLADALRFMDGACQRCLIDNSSVIITAGSGADAKMAADMEVFSATFGFSFVAHAVGRPQRKGRVERPFHYIEHNFLAGRVFNDWNELNSEAAKWCQEIANQKVKRVLGITPEAAYLVERPYLTTLPDHFPPVFQVESRVVDLEGYINLETNRYSVPEQLLGQKVEVHKHDQEVRIFHKGRFVAVHERPIGKRDARITQEGHHKDLTRATPAPPTEEQFLLGVNEVLDAYVAKIKEDAPGRGVVRLRRLLSLKRTYPPEPFLAAIRSAHHYGLYDLDRLERMILKQVAGDIFALDVG